MNKTSIEWTDFSANPVKYRNVEGKTVWGCVKASLGCTHCYAEALSKRFHGPDAGFTVGRMATLTPYLDEAELKAMLSVKRLPAGSKVFVGDMTDVFGPWVPDEMLDRMFAVFALRPDVVFQLLTKRPERMRAYLTWTHASGSDRAEAIGYAALTLYEKHGGDYSVANQMILGGNCSLTEPLPFWPLPNVWLGTSVEDQVRADERIPELLACPAAVRFLSVEPLLGHIAIGRSENWLDKFGGIDWVIVGGESGPGARPCDVGWIRSIVSQCQAAAVPVFVKQLGSQPVDPANGWNAFTGLIHGKGGDPEEWPEDLRVREFPEPRP